MFEFDKEGCSLVGPAGSIAVPGNDEITRRLAMLYEGKCTGLGAKGAAAKYGYSKQRYFQLMNAFRDGGAIALKSEKPGPKTNYRRTDEVVRQVIRHRFLDADASAEVVTQKLQQCGWQISKRSVQRIIEQYGLQKKTLQMSPTT